MTRYLLTRTRTIQTVEVLEIEAPSEDHARILAAEYRDPTPQMTVIDESLTAEAASEIE